MTNSIRATSNASYENICLSEVKKNHNDSVTQKIGKIVAGVGLGISALGLIYSSIQFSAVVLTASLVIGILSIAVFAYSRFCSISFSATELAQASINHLMNERELDVRALDQLISEIELVSPNLIKKLPSKSRLGILLDDTNLPKELLLDFLNHATFHLNITVHLKTLQKLQGENPYVEDYFKKVPHIYWSKINTQLNALLVPLDDMQRWEEYVPLDTNSDCRSDSFFQLSNRASQSFLKEISNVQMLQNKEERWALTLSLLSKLNTIYPGFLSIYSDPLYEVGEGYLSCHQKIAFCIQDHYLTEEDRLKLLNVAYKKEIILHFKSLEVEEDSENEIEQLFLDSHKKVSEEILNSFSLMVKFLEERFKSKEFVIDRLNSWLEALTVKYRFLSGDSKALAPFFLLDSGRGSSISINKTMLQLLQRTTVFGQDEFEKLSGLAKKSNPSRKLRVSGFCKEIWQEKNPFI